MVNLIIHILFINLELIKLMEKLITEDPKRCGVPKDKISYVVGILSRKLETQIIVHGIWILSTHKWNKAYVPSFGT